jgi:hypothetical protein
MHLARSHGGGIDGHINHYDDHHNECLLYF